MQAAGRVTVVIATANRRDELCGTLERLLALGDTSPIVVVDNHSVDGTPAVVKRRFPCVGVIALPSNEGAAARTIGARLAATPYVAFCDDDSWWEPGPSALPQTGLTPTLGSGWPPPKSWWARPQPSIRFRPRWQPDPSMIDCDRARSAPGA